MLYGGYMKKRILLLFTALFLMLCLLSCGTAGSRTPEEGVPSQDSIRLLNGKPEIDNALQTLAGKYREETGKTVYVETIGGDTDAVDELRKMYQADRMCSSI